MRGGSLSRTDISALFLRRGDELLMLWQIHTEIDASAEAQDFLPIQFSSPSSDNLLLRVYYSYSAYSTPPPPLMWVDSVIHHKKLV